MWSIDDRGQPVSLARVIPRGLIDRTKTKAGRVSAEQKARMNRATGMGCVWFFAIWILAIDFLLKGGLGMRFAIAILLIAMMLVGGLAAARRIWRIEAMQHLPSLGFCAACLYPIKGLPPAADDFSICPECGAAWRVDGAIDQSSKPSD